MTESRFEPGVFQIQGFVFGCILYLGTKPDALPEMIREPGRVRCVRSAWNSALATRIFMKNDT
jgi:hypothetical protein